MHLLSLTVHIGALILLGIFGVRKLFLIRTFLKNRDRTSPTAPIPETWPEVAVQLPIFNEPHVVTRLLRSAAKIDYPKEKLHIQILDDSTDSTGKLCRRMALVLKQKGFHVTHLQRGNRKGFKAGALKNGLANTTAQYIAVFDADSEIPADFLKRTVPFLLQPGRGWVQTRWGHRNRNVSLLTRLQAMILDGYFSIEHLSRLRPGKFFFFNGTAGIWNRRAITDAGGWEHDTLTEDIDLSCRAQLKGWRAVYLHDLVVPAELPTDMCAYKAQQHRWIKGSIQVAFKLAPRIWHSHLKLKTRVKIILQLLNNFVFAMTVLPFIMLFPLFTMDVITEIPKELEVVYAAVLLLAASGIASYYAVTLKVHTGKLLPGVLEIPLLVALGLGLSITQTRAALEACVGYHSGFVRTPKYNTGKKFLFHTLETNDRLGRIYQSVPEITICFYYLLCMNWFMPQDRHHLVPLLLLVVFGFAFCGFWPLFKDRRITE